MRDEMELLKERVEIYLHDAKNSTEVLKKTGIDFEDASEESGYPNYRFPCLRKEGYVRAYKGVGMKRFRVQIFRPIQVRYSGIPVFEPSERRSL